ncbi:MAG: hypothetical protein WDO69_23015 [Pseudomonadota bacterium]
MNTDRSSKRVQSAALTLAPLALIITLAYRAGGTNWAAGVGTAAAVSLWLWSARRSYREHAQGVGPQLIVDRAGELADEERSGSSYRRIRVANTGPRAVHQVEVTLAQCSPAPRWFQPVRLQRLHGGPHPFDLPPRTEVYVDLIALPQGHPEFIVVHDSARHGGLPSGIAIQLLELTVQVTANALPTVSFSFEASRSAKGVLELVAKSQNRGENAA